MGDDEKDPKEEGENEDEQSSSDSGQPVTTADPTDPGVGSGPPLDPPNPPNGG